MKKLYLLLLLIVATVVTITSCEPNNNGSDEQLGEVVSATYDPVSKSFIVKFSSGAEKTFLATIDDTVTPSTAGYAFDKKTYLYAPDATVASDATICKKVNRVSQFVYDGMSTYYYWADNMLNRKPKLTDANPANYFYRLLHSTDTKNGWSWITDDIQALLAGFSGESLSFGYDLGFIILNNKVYAYIKYVYADSPAANAGLERLDLIGKLNGNHITTEERNGNTYVNSEDVNLLYGNDAVTFTTYRFSEDQLVQDKEVTITPNNSSKDPVLLDTLYTIGDKTVGYLFYTNFYSNFNHHLYEAFSRFKQEGVTDLVLDLRYNTGGSVSSAVYLASLIAPRSVVENKSPFIVMDYNDYLNRAFDKWYEEASASDKEKWDRKYYLGTYNSENNENPLGANLNLNKVYIIATGNSYSASELILFCLRPYMEAVHIGSNTGGKYTASWTIHAYDNQNGQAINLYDVKELSLTEKNTLKNWGMQPIVAMFADKDSKNFSNTGHLVPNHALKEGFGYIDYWTPLGDTRDVLLGQALYLITGDENYKPVPPSTLSTRSSRLAKDVLTPREVARPVIIDNVKLTPDDFQKLRELLD
ncbi:MAG: S41 family peptidase [Fermentimonas sp.]|jgi:carboxyl-terminal processing protease